MNVRGKKFLVTGVGGFIGNAVAHALIAQGAETVLGIDRTLPANTHPGLQFKMFNLGYDELDNLIQWVPQDLAGIFHLAAVKHNPKGDNYFDLFASNVAGTAQILTLAQSCNNAKIVFSSSLYAYGRMHAPAFEEDENVAPETFYGESKYQGERILKLGSECNKVPITVVRYMFVYGPNQDEKHGYPSMIKKNMQRILQDAAPIINGDGKQVLDYIFIDDVVEATILCMNEQVNGETLNIGSGNPYSVNEIVHAMLKITEKDISPENAPSDWTDGTWRVASIQKIKGVLNWSPTVSLEAGLKRLIT